MQWDVQKIRKLEFYLPDVGLGWLYANRKHLYYFVIFCAYLGPKNFGKYFDGKLSRGRRISLERPWHKNVYHNIHDVIICCAP